MFMPRYFKVTDDATIRKFVRKHSFGTLVASIDGELDINHVPFVLLDEPSPHGILQGHIARANPLLRHLHDMPVAAAAVFDGPHGYISPRFYPSTREHGRSVPTWNYTTVHLHGRVRPVDDRDWIMSLLERLTAQYEGDSDTSWTPRSAPADHLAKLAGAIVGIELVIERVECQFKLSQNAAAADFAGAVAGLRAQHQDELADYMELAVQTA